MKKLLIVFIKVISFFIIWVVILSLFPISTTNSPAVWRLLAETIPLVAVILLTVVFLFVEKRNLSIIITKNPLKDTLIGLLIGSLWLGASLVILFAMGALKIQSVNEIKALSVWMLAAFLNVIMQELLFRGYMYQLIKSKYHLPAAVIVTTVLFTAMHGGAFEAGMIPVLNVITMSLFVTAVLEYTESLLTPIIIHAIWNIIGALIFGGVSLADDYPNLLNSVFTGKAIISGGAAKLEGSVVVLIINILLTCVFIFLIRKKHGKENL